MSTTQTMIGPQWATKGVTPLTLISGIGSELWVSELLPKYAGLMLMGRLFHANAAAVATSVPGTGMIGLQLWNQSKPASGVIAIPLIVSGRIIVTSATTTGLDFCIGSNQASAPTGQTAISATGNGYSGGAGSACLALNAGTFTNAPTARMHLMHNTAAIATTGEDVGFFVDMGGAFGIAPGDYCAIAAAGAAVAASGSNLSLIWAEIPVAQAGSLLGT